MAATSMIQEMVSLRALQMGLTAVKLYS